MRMLNPPHPGNFIRTEIIEPQGLSVTGCGWVPTVPAPPLSACSSGKAAVRGHGAPYGKSLCVKMDTLMRMQAPLPEPASASSTSGSGL